MISKVICTSTNSVAMQCLANGGLPEGTVVITDHQYQGRGQRGHFWYSEPHKNLTFSVVLYPTFLAAQHGFSLNIITTLAIQNVLVRYIPTGLSIKWPNDIYYQDKKLGGVLIEHVVAKSKLKACVIGIGLNVNQACFTFHGPTSLSLLCQRNFSLPPLLAQILSHLEGNYLQLQAQAMAPLQADYLKSMYWIHEMHTFQDAKHTFQGKITGIDATGKLVIEQADGTSKHYNMQEVIFIT